MHKFRSILVCLGIACGSMLSATAQDVINTVIGGGPNGIPGIDANLSNPYQTAVDAANSVYVADSGHNRVYKISSAGIITIVAGNGTYGYSGDNGPAIKAMLRNPYGVAVDKATPLANVYISDFNNCVVRKVNQSTGVITTIAGTVVVPTSGAPYTNCGYGGNGGPANKSLLNGPSGLTVNTTTNDVYFADYYNGVVRKINAGSPTGTISVVAGSGGSTTSGGNCSGSAPYGDTGTATSATLCYPQAVSIDNSVTPVNVFISEYGRCDMREVVGSSAKIYQIAGSYTLGCGFTDNVAATSAQLNDPWQSAISVSGATTTVTFADYNNARIRRFALNYTAGVPKSGTITTLAGKGQGGFCNDNGPALNACMSPVGLAYDAAGNYYIGDYGADRVREVVKATGNIKTIGGWGPNGGTQTNYSDPVGLTNVAGNPSLYYPVGVYADPNSNYVYVAGYYGEAVYRWDSSTNEISDVAGNGVAGFAGDGGLANNAATQVYNPQGVTKDPAGNVYITDSSNCAIRKVATNGNITTIAGGSSGALKGCGFSGDGGTAVNAQFNNPINIALDTAGNIYVADYYNCAIRKIAAGTTIVSTIAGGPALGCGYSGDGGPAVSAKIYRPTGVSLDSYNNLYITDQANNRIREIVYQTKVIQTVAGLSTGGYTGDGPAIGNTLNQPAFANSDAWGNLFIADTNNSIVRWVTPTGTMITIAGTPQTAGFSGDGGSAVAAQLYYPQSVSRDAKGNIYIADYQNNRVRQVTPFAGYGLSSANLSFETQAAGTMSDFQPVMVSAIGPTTISGISVTTGFSEIDDCAGSTLAAGDTCEIDVYFLPGAAGKLTGTLKIASNAKFALNPSSIALSGTGAGLALTGTLAFGVEPLKTPLASTVTLVNSGAATTIKKIYLTQVTDFTITGGTCPRTGGTLAAKASCTIIASFSPQTVGAKKSTLVVLSTDPASPLLAQATGTGTEIKTSTKAIAFGSISFGTTATYSLTISNTGTVAYTLTPSITGTGFSLSSTGKTCTTSVAAGASCVLPVQYNPSAVGSNTGTLTLTTNGGSNPAIPLTGSATADASVSPASLAFGAITHATTKVLNVTVTNVGKIAAMTVSGLVSGTNAAQFTLLTTGNTCGVAVAPGKSCVLPVQFKPAAVAAYAATLTVKTNGGTSPTVALTGSGK
jgi:hypothetical protein